MNKRFKLFGILAALLIGAIAYMAISELNNPKTKIDRIEIGKSFTIVLEESDVRDYTCLATEEFSLLKPDEVNKLKEYMEKNSLKIKPGSYDFNQTYRFEKLKKTLKFEK